MTTYEQDTKTLKGKPKVIQYKGYEGYVLQHPLFKHLNGYLQIPVTHDLHGKGYDDIEIDVHGGLTYIGEGLPQLEKKGYLIGFDCAHAGDWSPLMPSDWDTYRDIDFVENQIIHMIDQIVEKYDWGEF